MGTNFLVAPIPALDDELELDLQLKSSMWIATDLTPDVKGCASDFSNSPTDTSSGGNGTGGGGSSGSSFMMKES